MFVLNIRMDYKKIIIICLVIGILLAGVIEIFSRHDYVEVNSSIDDFDYIITDENFVLTLSFIHNNIDKNIGKRIKVSGFVYTLPDFNDDFFICGRYTTDENETKVAGYMCNYDKSISLEENEWIEIEGSIIKGNYNGEIPVIKVDKITKIIAPANTYVSKLVTNN